MLGHARLNRRCTALDCEGFRLGDSIYANYRIITVLVFFIVKLGHYHAEPHEAEETPKAKITSGRKPRFLRATCTHGKPAPRARPYLAGIDEDHLLAAAAARGVLRAEPATITT